MKAILLPALFSVSLATISPAQTCREVVRDASGRFGRTATTHTSGGSTSHTQFRDASGRPNGTETTSGHGATGRDASGRVTGSSTGGGMCPTVIRMPAAASKP
jgi:hypothetical protein